MCSPMLYRRESTAYVNLGLFKLQTVVAKVKLVHVEASFALTSRNVFELIRVSLNVLMLSFGLNNIIVCS